MLQVTKEIIIYELKRAGIAEGMNLEVHSSLSSFGDVIGGAHTVIGALKETVTEKGSIFMPALRLSKDLPLEEMDIQNGLVRKIRVLSADERDSRCGKVADTFRVMPDTKLQNGVLQFQLGENIQTKLQVD